jgi:phosphonate transport system substrate-binding protein
MLLLAGPVSAERYSFAVVPQQSALKTARSWAPVVQHLSRVTGISLVLMTESDIPGFEEQLQTGRYDFAYMNPYHYVAFHEQSGYQALAKARDKRIHGIVVVPRHSKIRTLEELAGQEVAFPAPGAFAASLLPRAEFRERRIPVTPVYVSSHDLVYRNVAGGHYPAGGGVFRTLHDMDRQTRDELRVLWTTEGYTPHAIASHPRVPEQLVAAVQQALIGLEDGLAGKAMLQNLKIHGFEEATDTDWDDIRALALDTL